MPRTDDPPTLILTDADVHAALDVVACADAVERAFALHATGAIPDPALLAVHVEGGGFHVKAAAATLARRYFAAKTNGNFPAHPARRGLPTIQGAVVLSDASDGRVLALIDSASVTTLRTGAATAVAARHLARPESATATIVGCGVQGRVQLRALAAVLPLEQAFAVDASRDAAQDYAREMSAALGFPVTPATDLGAALAASDVCCTCTPARTPFLLRAHVRPGMFIAAVGADDPSKSEIHPDVFRDATVVVDVLEQCLEIGDLRHAVAAGAIQPSGVHATLGGIAAGRKPGRRSPDERTLFDSTGTALQDVAAAAVVYERSVAAGRGLPIRLVASAGVAR